MTNFSEPLPSTFDLGFPLEFPISLRTRTGLQGIVENNRVLQLMGRIAERGNCSFWEPTWVSAFEEDLLTEPFVLWEPDLDRKVMPEDEATCGVAYHLVRVEGFWKLAYRQFLGHSIPRVCLNKILTSMSDWLANYSELQDTIGTEGEWVRVDDYAKLRIVLPSLRFALNANRP